ncbi:MAG: response regulator [Phycisphaerales bacterium]
MSPAPVPRFHDKRVLLVEDNFMVAGAVADMVRELGCTVVGPFGRLEDAETAARHDAYDAALLDVSIVGGSSESTARIVAARALPFIFVTGYGSAAAIAQDLRAAPRLTKPFGLPELAVALAAAFLHHPG